MKSIKEFEVDSLIRGLSKDEIIVELYNDFAIREHYLKEELQIQLLEQQAKHERKLNELRVKFIEDVAELKKCLVNPSI